MHISKQEKQQKTKVAYEETNTTKNDEKWVE